MADDQREGRSSPKRAGAGLRRKRTAPAGVLWRSTVRESAVGCAGVLSCPSPRVARYARSTARRARRHESLAASARDPNRVEDPLAATRSRGADRLRRLNVDLDTQRGTRRHIDTRQTRRNRPRGMGPPRSCRARACLATGSDQLGDPASQATYGPQPPRIKVPSGPATLRGRRHPPRTLRSLRRHRCPRDAIRVRPSSGHDSHPSLGHMLVAVVESS